MTAQTIDPRIAALIDQVLPQVPGVPDYVPLPRRVPGASVVAAHAEALNENLGRAVHALRMALRTVPCPEEIHRCKVEVNRAERARLIGNHEHVNHHYRDADLGEATRMDAARTAFAARVLAAVADLPTAQNEVEA
jgi:hypothetical protein